jgi:serine/threonine protein kinase
LLDKHDGWQIIEPLGEGGQGKVYKARSPERVRGIRNSRIEITRELRNIRDLAADEPLPEAVSKYIVDIGGPDPPEQLGALKIFKIPDGNVQEKSKAFARLQAEVKALMDLTHPAILRLLHAPHMAAEEHFIVTEYHSNGTLNQHLARFRGHALESLEAFRPLVEGIVAIHGKGAIHRDIKTQNIFVAADGRLVLGDFGIVFFRDATGTRFTETYGERVGSHYWMAPWAYEPVRLESVRPSLDIFPLAKVLWSMIAGRDGPPFQDYAHRDYNLEILFAGNPAMPVINGILSKCIVRDEENCLESADEMLKVVDSAMDEIRHAGQRPKGNNHWPCRVCGKGRYVRDERRTTIQYEQRPGVLAGAFGYSAFICDTCKHCEFFRE